MPALLVALICSSCSSFKPEPQKEAENVEGPGLFSGEKGEFEISVDKMLKQETGKK